MFRLDGDTHPLSHLRAVGRPQVLAGPPHEFPGWVVDICASEKLGRRHRSFLVHAMVPEAPCLRF